MMKKLTFLLAGILLLCGCQQVLIQPDRVTGIYAQAEFETARTALPQSMQDDVLEVLASETKRYSGIETVEHFCRIGVNERQEAFVKLVFTKETCTWKMVFL